VIYTDLGMMGGVTSFCEDCQGRRFQAPVLEYRLGGLNIAEVLDLPVSKARAFFGEGPGRAPAALALQVRKVDAGLGYLGLGQPLPTLSGGERQRLKLATHMGSAGGIYVLDEPTIGLHLADLQQLLGLLDRLVDSGKSLLVVEHHLSVMAHADWIIDLGPGAGHDGGGSSSRVRLRNWWRNAPRSPGSTSRRSSERAAEAGRSTPPDRAGKSRAPRSTEAMADTATPRKPAARKTAASGASRKSEAKSSSSGESAAAAPAGRAPAPVREPVEATRLVGLSLGADICWPGCYEEIVSRLNLRAVIGDEAIRFATERITVEPFDLKQPCRYTVVLDRLTHWFHTSREWIKKACLMDGLYVLNNPWSLQSMEKHSTYCAMMALGLPVPETWMVPPKEHGEENPDIHPTLARYARLFDLGEVGDKLGYPMFMKPYDGGAWVGVSRIDDDRALRNAYEKSGRRVMHLQRAVDPFDLFVRTIGIGPQVEVVRYDPGAPLHDRYKVDFFFVDGDEWSLLNDQMITINSFFGWEFNSCESLRKAGVFHPIDFANACPDFQVTSLHYHFPNLVKDMVRWSLFCAATRRKMRLNMDWEPYFEVAKRDLPYREKLREYAKIGHQRFETDRFRDFCDKHLSHLDEVAWEFFGTERAKELVRAKVAALYPAHEIEQFASHFFGLIQFWRKTEADRLARRGLSLGKPAAAEASP
jgi:hypothetical protein